MRASVPHCRALFEPENVVCVGRMVAEVFLAHFETSLRIFFEAQLFQLLERTEKLKDRDVVLTEVLPPAPKSEEVEQPENTEDETES